MDLDDDFSTGPDPDEPEDVPVVGIEDLVPDVEFEGSPAADSPAAAPSEPKRKRARTGSSTRRRTGSKKPTNAAMKEYSGAKRVYPEKAPIQAVRSDEDDGEDVDAIYVKMDYKKDGEESTEDIRRAIIENHLTDVNNDRITFLHSSQDDNILSMQHLLLCTLRMLQMRGGYLVDDLIFSILKLRTAKQFVLALLLPTFKNPVRDILCGRFTTRTPPFLRTLMSMVVHNPTGDFTALFFAEKGHSQVSRQLLGQLFGTLAYLRAMKIHVTEIILVTPAFSSDNMQFHTNVTTGCFSKVFLDEEVLLHHDYRPELQRSILNPHISRHVFAPTIRLLSKDEQVRFLEEHVRTGTVTAARIPQVAAEVKIPQMSHNDALLKSMGIRPKNIVEIRRPPIMPESICRSELSYAWVY